MDDHRLDILMADGSVNPPVRVNRTFFAGAIHVCHACGRDIVTGNECGRCIQWRKTHGRVRPRDEIDRELVLKGLL